ncbi:MAG: hypothetical protein P8Z80_12685 [Pseudolabrys sp.]|jgi:hypothetical protein
MLTAMILVCSLATIPNLGDCNRYNAVGVMWMPETFNNPITCYMHSQAYIAGTGIGRSLAADEHVKVLCLRKKRAAALPVDRAVAGRSAPTVE